MPTPDAPLPKAKGTPLGVALLIIVGVAILGMVGVGYVFFSMRGENRKLAEELEARKAGEIRAEIERQKAAESEKRTVAANRQGELLTQVRAATNILERLLSEVVRVKEAAEALKSNEDGRRVALHPELVRQARAFFSTQLPELPQRGEVITKIEATRRTEQELLGASGTVHQPEADLTTATASTMEWAKQAAARTERLSTLLLSLIAESKIKFTQTSLSPSSPTLDAAMKELAEGEASAARTTLAEETTKAKRDADQTRADAEAEKIREEAKRDAARIRAEADELKAEVEREIAVKKAEQIKETAKAKVEVETVVDEARKIELRKKASDPQIQAKLSSFTTPGYWQLNEMTLDKMPLSFTKLKNSGALEPTVKGGAILARIVSSSTDRVRPRWKINHTLYTRHPDAIERVKEAQQLLTELGPVLVEMKQLEP